MTTEKTITRLPFTAADIPGCCCIPLGRASTEELRRRLNRKFGLTHTIEDEVVPPSEPPLPLTQRNITRIVDQFVWEIRSDPKKDLRRELDDDRRRDAAVTDDSAMAAYLDWALGRFPKFQSRLSKIPAWRDPAEEIRADLFAGMRADGLRHLEEVGLEATVRRIYETIRRLTPPQCNGRIRRVADFVNIDGPWEADSAPLSFGVRVGEPYLDSPEQRLIDAQARAKSQTLEAVLTRTLTPAQAAAWTALKRTLWKNKAGNWRFNKVEAAKQLPIDHTTVSRHAAAIRERLAGMGAHQWIPDEFDLEVA